MSTSILDAAAAADAARQGGAAKAVALPPMQFIRGPAGVPVPAPTAPLLALYFSAHWCAPCRKFTPLLAQFYANTSRDDLEVAFVSLDQTEEQFQHYYGTMPWLALHYTECEREEIYEQLQVQGIPALVVFSPSSGKLLTLNGRTEVQNAKTPQELVQHWKSQLST